VISGLAVDPAALWPPNHKLKTVAVVYTLSDNCGAATAELLVSSGASRGGKGLDAQVVDDHHVLLAADGEQEYLITVVATDGAGNRSAASIAIGVGPRSR